MKPHPVHAVRVIGGVGGRPGLFPSLARLWERRSLLLALVSREVRAKYIGTALGLFWIVLEPALLVTFYTFLFGVVFQVRMGAALAKMSGVGEGSYALFVLTGLVPWLAFSNGLVGAARSVAQNRAIITKVVFPVELFPIASVMSAQVAFSVMTTIVVVIAAFARGVSVHLLWIPLIILVLLLLSIGFGYVLAVVSTFFRDVSNVVPFLMSLWMYSSPVVYPREAVPESLRKYLFFNPMTGVIESYRGAVLFGEPPDLRLLAYSIAVAIAVFLFGFWMFRRAQVLFAEVL